MPGSHRVLVCRTLCTRLGGLRPFCQTCGTCCWSWMTTTWESLLRWAAAEVQWSSSVQSMLCNATVTDCLKISRRKELDSSRCYGVGHLGGRCAFFVHRCTKCNLALRPITPDLSNVKRIETLRNQSSDGADRNAHSSRNGQDHAPNAL